MCFETELSLHTTGDSVPALHKSVLKVSSTKMGKLHVSSQRPEQWYASTKQNRDPRDGQLVDHPCIQKALDRLTAINIDVARTLLG